MAKRVLITGGSGFIGTNLVQRHVDAKDQVISLDVAPPRNEAHRPIWERRDILDESSITALILAFRPDVVYHLAARTDLRGESERDYVANTEGVSNVIRAVQRCGGVGVTVFASSMLVCRIGYIPTHEIDYCPTTAYGRSKVAGEQRVRAEAAGAFPWVIVRPTSIWGPWFGSPYRDFFEMVVKRRYVHPRGVGVRRTYGFVGNAVHQLTTLAELQGADLVGRAVYLGDYEPIDVRSWANCIARTMGQGDVAELPLPIFRAAAWIGDMLVRLGYASAPMTSFRLNNMLTEAVLDIHPISRLCGPLPYSMEDGVRLTCEWVKQFC